MNSYLMTGTYWPQTFLYWPADYWPEAIIVGFVVVTLRARSLAVTLNRRTLAVTLKPRSLSVTLEEK